MGEQPHDTLPPLPTLYLQPQRTYPCMHHVKVACNRSLVRVDIYTEPIQFSLRKMNTMVHAPHGAAATSFSTFSIFNTTIGRLN